MGESPDRSQRTAGEEREPERTGADPAVAPATDGDSLSDPTRLLRARESAAKAAAARAAAAESAAAESAASEEAASEEPASEEADVPATPGAEAEGDDAQDAVAAEPDAERADEAGAEDASPADVQRPAEPQHDAEDEDDEGAEDAAEGEHDVQPDADAEHDAEDADDAEPAAAASVAAAAPARAIRDPRLPDEASRDAEESAPPAEPLKDLATTSLRVPADIAAASAAAAAADADIDGDGDDEDEDDEHGPADEAEAEDDAGEEPGGGAPAAGPGGASASGAGTDAGAGFGGGARGASDVTLVAPLPPGRPGPSGPGGASAVPVGAGAGRPAGATAVAESPETTVEAMDILAGLSNRPMTPTRRALRRVRLYGTLLVVLAIVLAAVQLLRPLPSPKLSMTAASSFAFDGSGPQLDFPVHGQAAVEVPGLGVMGHSGSDDPVPLASVTKVMTAYLVLRDHPLKKGEQGPTITVDQQAVDDYNTGKPGGESVMKVSLGEQLTEYQALQMLLIPSANNVARMLGRWDAGSQAAFVQKMQATAGQLGMDKTTYTDPSGLTGTTRSTANDQLKLAKAAMADPVFREIVGTASFDPPENGLTQNNNALLLKNGVIGIKTGTSSAALGNLMWAARQKVGGTTETIYGVVLSQPAVGGDGGGWLPQVLEKSKKLIISAEAALQSHTLAHKGDVVGYVDNGLGGRTPVVATQDVNVAGWSGLSVGMTLVPLAGEKLPHSATEGTVVGDLVVGSGANAQTIPVAVQSAMSAPGLGEKLTRLA